MATAEESPPFDKEKLAIALAYDREKTGVPRVAAKGKGVVAEAIIALAQKSGIEVREDSDLALLLSKLDIDMPIPLEAYAAVAEILAYVYKVNDKARRKHDG